MLGPLADHTRTHRIRRTQSENERKPFVIEQFARLLEPREIIHRRCDATYAKLLAICLYSYATVILAP